MKRSRCTTFGLGMFFATISSASLAAPTSGTCPGANAMYSTTNYRDLFADYSIATDSQVQTKLNSIWNQLFVPGSATESNRGSNTILYNTSDGKSYIWNSGDNDIRSEGMSYGMMIAIQMNQQDVFNRLWNFAVTRMLQNSAGKPHHFAWQLNATSPYTAKDTGAAPDGEEYMAMALWFAHHRWGSLDPNTGNDFAETSTDYRNYRYWAWTMLDIVKNNMSNAGYYQVQFVPGSSYTDPSYHLPAFYELWALWTGGVVVDFGPDSTNYWRYAADASRTLFNGAISANSANSGPPLTSEYTEFNGNRVAANTNGNANASNFAYDSWRVISNMAVDYNWCSGDSTIKTLVKNQLTWFNTNGAHDVYDLSTRAWKDSNNSPGIIAMNAVGALAMDSTNSSENSLASGALQKVWNLSTPNGTYRYYNGLLYTMGMLHTAGKFNIWSWWWNSYYMTPRATMMLDNSLANTTKAQPRLTFTNNTAATLSNFKAKYFFTAENGKTPVVDNVSSANFTASLVQEDNNLWSVTMNFAGKTLQPGQKLPASGFDTFTIHYSDNSAFDKSNDFSQPVSGSTYNTTNRVAVFDAAGNRVMGDVPGNKLLSYNAKLKSTWSNNLLTASDSPNNSDAKAQPFNSSWTSQNWQVEPVNGSSYVRLKNTWSGRYLNVQSQVESARVVTYDYNGGWGSEMWILEPVSGTANYRLRNVWSGKYLTVLDTTNYSNIYSQTLNASWASQVWSLQ